MAIEGDDGTGAEVHGIKDTVKRLASQAKGAIKDEAKASAARLGLRAVSTTQTEALKNPTVKKVIADQKKAVVSNLVFDAKLVGLGLLAGLVFFGRKRG